MHNIPHYCPQCRSKKLLAMPHPVGQIYSIKYECGGEVLYKVKGDYWEWKNECTLEDIDDGK